MADGDVGGALTGRYADFRRSENVEDRRDETMTPPTMMELLKGVPDLFPSIDKLKWMAQNPNLPIKEYDNPIPATTPLANELGYSDVKKPTTQEIVDHMLGVQRHSERLKKIGEE